MYTRFYLKKKQQSLGTTRRKTHTQAENTITKTGTRAKPQHSQLVFLTVSETRFQLSSDQQTHTLPMVAIVNLDWQQ